MYLADSKVKTDGTTVGEVKKLPLANPNKGKIVHSAMLRLFGYNDRYQINKGYSKIKIKSGDIEGLVSISVENDEINYKSLKLHRIHSNAVYVVNSKTNTLTRHHILFQNEQKILKKINHEQSDKESQELIDLLDEILS